MSDSPTEFARLAAIDSPVELRALPFEALAPLANEMRQFILQSVAKTGGHLSSNLGTVELAIALHYVFDTPNDRLVWDVGHQAYAHKILTGRRDALARIRQKGGLSGFPVRQESPYDHFGTAHASTSISAALGMALAARAQGDSRYHVAVIGDGALSGGMALEAMNHAGVEKDVRLLVILNDNEMSISRPVGAISRYLARLLSSHIYRHARDVGKTILNHAPDMVREAVKRLEEHTKGMLVPSTLFEHFGFHYLGPVDGHDFDSLIPTLRNLRNLPGPQLLHIVTQKGRGYDLALQDPIAYHGPTPFDPAIGIVPAAPKRTFTQVFSEWVCATAEHDERLFAITPAMREGSGLVEFSERFPTRYFDVAIAEQHAVTLAAGLACESMKPVVAIYSTFLQRAYDQLIHDVALQNLDVTFAIDRAGIVGADGATHAGLFDLAYLRCIPNIVIAVPSDEIECRLLLQCAYDYLGPAAVRYPRGGSGAVDSVSRPPAVIGKGRWIEGPFGRDAQLTVLVFGTLLPVVQQALKSLPAMSVNLVDMRFVKPLDTELLQNVDTGPIVTVEEGVISGGAGSAVAEYLSTLGHASPILHLGWPDVFPIHGTQAEVLAEGGLDAATIASRIAGFLRAQK